MRNFVFLTSALGRSGNAVAGYGPAGIIRRTSSTLTVWESGLKYLALFLDNDDADDTNNINTTSPAHHSYMHPFLRPVKIGFVQPSRAKQNLIFLNFKENFQRGCVTQQYQKQVIAG